MKKCSVCKKTKPITDFYKHSGHPDGYRYECKDCSSVESRSSYKNRSKEKILAKRERNKEQAAEYTKKIRKMFPEKSRSYNVLAYAIKTGKIIRPDCCSTCGIDCKPVGHHDDYSKPLEVVWLCSNCHNQLHHSIHGGV